jgi:hypothetical protein
LHAHRNNIHRYRRLLRTKLSEIEREFIERRLAEEQLAVEGLTAAALPIAPAAAGALSSILARGRAAPDMSPLQSLQEFNSDA